MNILIACEESQRVCTAFREKGHNAFSCDIIECSGGHPEWHIQGDCLPLLNGNCEFETADGKTHYIDGKWDLIIAHPPCTYFSTAGANWLFRGGKLNMDRYEKGLEMKALFMGIWNADCDRICIENVVAMKIWQLPVHTQEVQPFQFGDPFLKKQGFGLKIWHRCFQQKLCSLYQNGFLVVIKKENFKTMQSARRMTTTDRKPSTALQKPWQNNGGKKNVLFAINKNNV